MVPTDSGLASGFAGPQIESRSCSGTGITAGGGGGGGGGGRSGTGGGATGAFPSTTTVSDRGASVKRCVGTCVSRPAATATSAVVVENPSSWNSSVTGPAGSEEKT